MLPVLVPLMLFLSSVIMAFAWLAHMRFRSLRFSGALALSWIMVLPEYVLNVTAFRWGNESSTQVWGDGGWQTGGSSGSRGSRSSAPN